MKLDNIQTSVSSGPPDSAVVEAARAGKVDLSSEAP